MFSIQTQPSNIFVRDDDDRCPITRQIMRDPVILVGDTFTYEREAIEEWLESNNTSPRTRAPLASNNLIPNGSKQSFLKTLLEKHPELLDAEDEVYLPKSWQIMLTMAITNKNIDSTRSLLSLDKRLLTTRLNENGSALHLACLHYSAEVFDLIFGSVKKNPEALKEYFQKSDAQKSILATVAIYLPNRFEEFLELANKAQFTRLDESGNNPLIQIFKFQKPVVFCQFLEKTIIALGRDSEEFKALLTQVASNRANLLLFVALNAPQQFASVLDIAKSTLGQNSVEFKALLTQIASNGANLLLLVVRNAPQHFASILDIAKTTLGQNSVEFKKLLITRFKNGRYALLEIVGHWGTETDLKQLITIARDTGINFSASDISSAINIANDKTKNYLTTYLDSLSQSSVSQITQAQATDVDMQGTQKPPSSTLFFSNNPQPGTLKIRKHGEVDNVSDNDEASDNNDGNCNPNKKQAIEQSPQTRLN